MHERMVPCQQPIKSPIMGGCLGVCFYEDEEIEVVEQIELNERSDLRVKVLLGRFVCAEGVYEIWKTPSKKLIVFVSSTFTDTHEERNIILKEILPELQTLGREQGIEVIFVDMRYGVKDESTLRQMTWNECSGELETCKKESAGQADHTML